MALGSHRKFAWFWHTGFRHHTRVLFGMLFIGVLLVVVTGSSPGAPLENSAAPTTPVLSAAASGDTFVSPFEKQETLIETLRNEGKTTEAIALAAQILASDSHYAWGHYAIASCLLDAGSYTEAIEQYEKVLALVESGQDSSMANLPFVYSDMGLAYRKLNNVEKAMTLYQKAIELDPTDPIPHANLAAVFHERGQFAKALEHAEQSLAQSDPSIRPHALFWKGRALMDLKRREQAINTFEQYIQEYPAAADADEIRDYIVTLKKDALAPPSAATQSTDPTVR
jgi:tetratricopeptide (TPR) repeat protein